MKDSTNILDVGALSPDLMGFIFYETSPRWVGNDFAMPSALAPSIRRVGVFVNEHVEKVLNYVKKHNLDYVQLHGIETVEQCRALKLTGVGVIKAFAVDGDFDFAATDKFKGVADYFLFDAKGNRYGGNGIAFDWNLLTTHTLTAPWFLSGGLTPDNIKKILKMKLPGLHGLDVNSGVEAMPGIKDLKKVNELFHIN